MTKFFDSFAMIALFNARDQYHRPVAGYMGAYRGRLVTTEWLIVEFLDAYATPDLRMTGVMAVEQFRNDPNLEIVPYSQSLSDAGWELYRGRPDKGWSLTDCISFTVMAERQLIDALTGDHHFRQAGFNPIFAPSAP